MLPKIDLNKNGLNMFFQPYEEILISHAFETKDEFNSRDAMRIVNDGLITRGLESISRASIINFLNDMVDAGILTYREETCKGGGRRVYTAHTGKRQIYKASGHEMNLTNFVNLLGQAFYEKLHELAPRAKLVPVIF